jgi:general secretion pathway protein L
MSEWRGQIQASLGDIVKWWLGELAELVPESVRRRFVGQRTRLVLLVDAPGDNLLEETGQRSRRLGRIDLDPPASGRARRVLAAVPRAARNGATGLVLRFPASRALRTPVSLPLAADKNLPEVIGFEFERLVPFSRPDVYYAYRVTARDKQGQMLRLELVVLPRSEVAKLSQKFDALGLRVAGLEVAEPGLEFRVTSIPLGDREAGSAMQAGRRITIGLLAAATVLALICLAVPFWRASAAIETLTAQMAEARQQAETAAALQKQIDAKRQEQQFLTDRKRAMPTVTELLATLTRLIPDDAYLTEMTITGDHVHLVGAANSATALLTLIDQSPAFRGAAFQSSIVQDPRLNRERFDITAGIAQRGGS